MSEEEKKTFKQKNTHIDAWIPNSLAEWLNAYLEKHSSGTTFAEKLKSLFYRLQELDEQGKTITTLKRTPIQTQQSNFLGVKPSLICVAMKPLKNMTADAIARTCHSCKILEPSMFKACQELRKEQEEAKTQ